MAHTCRERTTEEDSLHDHLEVSVEVPDDFNISLHDVPDLMHLTALADVDAEPDNLVTTRRNVESLVIWLAKGDERALSCETVRRGMRFNQWCLLDDRSEGPDH